MCALISYITLIPILYFIQSYIKKDTSWVINLISGRDRDEIKVEAGVLKVHQLASHKHSHTVDYYGVKGVQ